MTGTPSSFSEDLLHWYAQFQRDLPWRNTTDPYKIWLSEIILQQTRVQQGMPYYLTFVEAYPTVHDLANAPEEEVLRLWQGLGYYSRARNLMKAAKQVIEEFGGDFPDNYQDLLKLKGVGNYTAAAIASFAFKEPVGVVDGNVFRVLARLYGIEEDIASHAAKKTFQQLANELISRERPDLHNQAIMEFGATHCTPQKPNCLFCPFTQWCEARKTGRQSALPIKLKKTKVTNRFFHYIVFEHNGKLYFKQREGKGIWQGLFDFYLIEKEELTDWEELISDELLSSLQKEGQMEQVEKSAVTYQHILSHQRIQADFYLVKLKSEIDLSGLYQIKPYAENEIEKLAKPVLILKYLSDHSKLNGYFKG